MSLETFLINPVGKRKRKTSGTKRRKRSGGLPSGLLSRMIRTHGIKRGMKEAWKEFRSGKRNPRTLPRAYRSRVTHRPVVYGTGRGVWKRSPLATGKRLENPFGEEVMIVGNPRRRRRRKVRRSNPLNPPRRRKRRRSILSLNPRRVVRHRRKRKSYRRNPATALAISPRRPMSLLMPAAVGAGGFFAADYIPIAIGQSASPITRLGIKAAIAIGGGMLLSRFLGAKNATAFSLGVGINVLNDVLKTYVFKTAATAGLGAFVRPRLSGGMSGMGAISPFQSTVPRYPS